MAKIHQALQVNPQPSVLDASEEEKMISDQDQQQERDTIMSRQRELEQRINAGFSKRNFLNQETGLSLQELTCLYCSVKYSKLSNMKDHIRTHLAVKMFECSICCKGFVW